jgi:hypothetical protein
MKRKLVTAAVAAALTTPVWADPPPRTDLPSVFCLRITDMERVAGDAENDRFRIELEILNWTNTAASGFSVAANIGTSAGVSIVGAGIDRNGRGGTVDQAFDDIPAPEGPGGVPAPPGSTENPPFMSGMGNVDNPNPWRVLQQDVNTAVWTDPDLLFGNACDSFFHVPSYVGEDPTCGSENALQNIDLNNLFAKGPAGAAVARLSPLAGPPLDPDDPPEGTVLGTDATGDSSVDGGEGVDLGVDGLLGFEEPVQGDVENALDGLVLEVDGFKEGDVLSLNWNLLGFFDDGNGGGFDAVGPSAIGACDQAAVTTDCFYALGTANFGGNPYGFGMLNLTLAAPGTPPVGPVFEGNTGFNQNPVLFYTSEDENGNPVSVASIPNPVEVFGEVGAGQFGQFRGDGDIFDQTSNPNANFVDPLGPQAVPAPATLLMLGSGLVGAFTLGGWRRRRTPRWS